VSRSRTAQRYQIPPSLIRNRQPAGCLGFIMTPKLLLCLRAIASVIFLHCILFTAMILPQTSAVRNPILIFMPPTSTLEESPPQPTATRLPEAYDGTAGDVPAHLDNQWYTTDPTPTFLRPGLRLEMRNLEHPGAHQFLSAVNASTIIEKAVDNVLRLLYNSPADHTTNAPPTRSVTVILRDMDGVAYTTRSELDNDHKEIHFSLRYISGIQPPSRAAHEIAGILTHELVHCHQWNAKDTCPGGIIEGVADWVRLNCALSPPHWKRSFEGAWDRGYEHTAYFFQYLEGRFGEGTVRRMNEKLRLEKYNEKPFWTDLLGRPVEQLYEDYKKDQGKVPLSVAQNGASPNASGGTIDEGTQT
jgi:hypothetical protein